MSKSQKNFNITPAPTNAYGNLNSTGALGVRKGSVNSQFSKTCRSDLLPEDERSSPIKTTSLYTANTSRVPHYYERPGPGHYEIINEASFGRKAFLSTNANPQAVPISRRTNVSRTRKGAKSAPRNGL